MSCKSMLLGIVLSFAAITSQADTLQYATANGAIDGYDPVAYFTDGEAARGSPDITTTWNGAEWRFTSEAHRDAFIADPEKYAPQYGGFCALGMAHGAAVPTDPQAWTIYQDRLYLNMIPAVAVTWRYNPDKLVPRADENWAAANPQ